MISLVSHDGHANGIHHGFEEAWIKLCVFLSMFERCVFFFAPIWEYMTSQSMLPTLRKIHNDAEMSSTEVDDTKRQPLLVGSYSREVDQSHPDAI